MTPPQRQRRFPAHEPSARPSAGAAPATDVTGNPERLFVIGGDAGGERADMDLVTLIVARTDPPASATPEQAA
ncbi:DUF742 domain-containing protein, partial [Streptomyces sp. TRM76130]|nr:DUF742 domain-containing protein [Streptomyces sp. TRM76130]